MFIRKRNIEESVIENKKISMKIIQDFEREVKEQYKIKKEIEFIHDFERTDHDNITNPGVGNEKTVIAIGFQGYDIENLTDKQWLKLKNTIMHELLHVRNRESLLKDVHDKLDGGKYRRTVGHFAYLLLDDYIAYREANDQFREEVTDLHCTEVELVNIFYSHMLKGHLMIEGRNIRTEDDKAMFYRAFCDNCIAIIPIFILKGKLDGKSKEIERMNNSMEILLEGYKKWPLSWEEYIELGESFIKSIIKDLSGSQRRTFRDNTEIIFK